MVDSVVHIVPRHVGTSDGISQYARALARNLKMFRHIFLHHADDGRDKLDCGEELRTGQGFSIHSTLGRQHLDDATIVLLHYVGYGYSRRGSPSWLARLLSRTDATLITFFHELDATGNGFSRGVVYSFFQRRVIRALIERSSVLVTSTLYYADRIRKLDPWFGASGAFPLVISEVPSGIGEPSHVPPIDERENAGVVFGTPGRRKAVYEDLGSSFGVSRILDIGERCNCTSTSWRGVPVEYLGPLADDDVSRILLRCRYGFIDYPPLILGKSSILAAYTSHGIVPILTGKVSQVELDTSALCFGKPGLTAAQWTMAQLRNRRWYDQHSARILAGKVLEAISAARPRGSKRKVLFVSANQTQNSAPLRYFMTQDRFAPLVAICTDSSVPAQGEEWINRSCFASRDPSIQAENAPQLLTDCVPMYVRNYAFRPMLGRWWGVLNPHLVRLCCQADANVVFGHNYATLAIVTIVSRVLCKATVVSTDATDFGSSSIKGRLKRILFPIWYTFFCSAVIVPSSKSKKFLVSLGVSERKIFTTPYSSDEELLTTAVATGGAEIAELSARLRRDSDLRPIALFVGKLIERKGIRLLVDAWKSLRLRHRLVVVGEGPLLSEMRDSTTIADDILWEGFVPYSKLPLYYAACDLLIHPAEVEPWGLPVSEAMILGRPVLVSSAVGAGDDLVLEGITGWRFSSGSKESLVEKLQIVLSMDREQYHTMGEAARVRVEQFSSRKNAEQIVAALDWCESWKARQ